MLRPAAPGSWREGELAPWLALRGSYSESVDKALRALFLALAVFGVIGWLPRLVSLRAGVTDAGVAGSGIVAAVLVAVCVTAVVGLEGTVAAAIGAAAAVAGTLVASFESPDSSTWWWPTNVVAPIAVYCLCATRRVWRFPLAAAVLVGSLVGHLRVSRSGDVLPLLYELLVVAALVVTAMIVHDGLRKACAEADGVKRAQEVEEQRAADLQLAAQQQEDAERFIHDTLVHGLRAIALTDAGVTEAAARDACREAADGIDARERDVGGRDLGATLRTLARRQPIAVRVTGTAVLGNPAAVAAFVGAVAEALRNVVRHAGVEEAQVAIEALPSGARVSVIDRGKGFDAHELPSGHRGIAQSIVNRMADVGGTAAVRSAPGAGTTVGLEWHVPGSVERVSDQVLDLSSTAQRIIPVVPLPTLIASLLGAAVGALLRPGLWPTAAAAGLDLAIGLVVVGGLARRGIQAGTASAIAAGALLAAVINMATQPEPLSSMFVCGGASAMLIAIVVLFQPLWYGLSWSLAMLLVPFAIMIARFGWAGFGAHALGILSAEMITLGSAVAGRVIFQWQARRIAGEIDAAEAARLRSSELEARAREVTDRLARLADASALIHQVAAGSIRPGNAAVREKARLLELAARDELQVHGRVPMELRQVVTSLRRRGWRVVLNADAAELEAGQRNLLRALRTLRGEDGGSITVAPGEGRGLSVLCVGPGAAALGAAPGVVEVDEDYTRVTLPVPITWDVTQAVTATDHETRGN